MNPFKDIDFEEVIRIINQPPPPPTRWEIFIFAFGNFLRNLTYYPAKFILFILYHLWAGLKDAWMDICGD